MRIRDIKVGMTVRVKANAHKLTKESSPCFCINSMALAKMQGKSGVVTLVDSDGTIKVKFEGNYCYSWFDPIHLEKDIINPLAESVPLMKVVITAENRKANITKLKSELAAAVKDLETFNNKFSIENIFSGTIGDGVYTISGSNGKCVITKGVPLWVTSYIIQPLDRRVWKDSTFTLTKMKPSITFN